LSQATQNKLLRAWIEQLTKPAQLLCSAHTQQQIPRLQQGFSAGATDQLAIGPSNRHHQSSGSVAQIGFP
jgi:hypothetical protein